MNFRNQIIDIQKKSLNPLLSKQRTQKYKTHLSRIFEIQSRISKSKPKKQAKLIQSKIQQLTKLKEFARNFKAKELQIQRQRNNAIMLTHIQQRMHTTNLASDLLRTTKSSIKLSSRKISASQKRQSAIQLDHKNKQQNKRLVKSISQNSFDQKKFRDTLRATTQDYLKLRNHMRKMKKDKESIKRLKTQPNPKLDIIKEQAKNLGKQSFQKSYYKLSKMQDPQSLDQIKKYELKFAHTVRQNITNQTILPSMTTNNPHVRLVKQKQTQNCANKLKKLE